MSCVHLVRKGPGAPLMKRAEKNNEQLSIRHRWLLNVNMCTNSYN